MRKYSSRKSKKNYDPSITATNEKVGSNNNDFGSKLATVMASSWSSAIESVTRINLFIVVLGLSNGNAMVSNGTFKNNFPSETKLERQKLGQFKFLLSNPLCN